VEGLSVLRQLQMGPKVNDGRRGWQRLGRMSLIALIGWSLGQRKVAGRQFVSRVQPTGLAGVTGVGRQLHSSSGPIFSS
jgi:hypothetical protein